MSTRFQPIEIPPGVAAKPTKNMRSSNWASANLVRWIEGELHPVGGQAQFQFTITGRTTSAFASRCKAIHGWYNLANEYLVAYVCEQNVYVDLGGGELKEITPAGGWPPVLSGVGGYGDGDYSADDYGTPRPLSLINALDKIPDVWSVDNFGAVLLVMNSLDGTLLMWDPAGTASALAPITASAGTVPKGRLFVVTQERFVIVCSTADDGTVDGGFPWRFAWCDQEDYTDWDYASVTNQAGYLDVQPASPIITAHAGRFGTLLFTAKKAYLVAYQGLPYIYGCAELADNCTPWSAASITTTSSYFWWMSQQGAFSFDGSSIGPVACAVRAWITDDIDLINVRQQACAVHVEAFNEVWWFYPQDGEDYNTRCVIYNYREGWWSEGQMSRSAGITASFSTPVLMADGEVVFQHELGNVYGNADPPWAETFDLNLTSGVRLATLKQVVPDVGGDAGNLQFSFFAQNSRSKTSSLSQPGQGGATPGIWTPPVPIRSDGYVDARVTGRDLRMKISIIDPANILPFTLGQHLVDFAVRGDR